MDYARLRPHLTATLVLGLPLIGSHLARMAIGISDTVMVGRYSVEALAALVVASSLLNVLFFLGMGFGVGVMGPIATAVAAGRETEVRRLARMALWLSMMFALLMQPLFWFSEPILLALGQEPVIAATAQDYLRIAGIGLLPMLVALTLNSYLAALERTQVVLWVTLLGLPVNIAFNWVLIFGNLGAPELGVRGAAIASVSVQMIQIVLLIVYAMWLPATRRFQLFARFWRPDWSALATTFSIGMPIGLTLVAEGGLFTASNLMMGWIGTIELAAQGIALQLASIAFMVPLGLSQAATVRIGQAKGLISPDRMRDAGVAAIWLSLFFVAITILMFLTIPRFLAELYLDPTDPQTPAIIAVAAMLLFYAALFQLADSLQVVGLGLLRGVHDTRVPMWIALFSYWVIGMPVAYGLTFTAGVGPAGIWLGLLAGLTVAAIAMHWRFWRGLARGDWTRLAVAG